MLIAGVDEAGRGPLAGPVVAAAVILDPARPIAGLRDSKLLTRGGARAPRRGDPRARARLGGGARGRRRDRRPQHPAGDDARDAARGRRPCAVAPTRRRIDGNRCPELGCPARAIVQGDRDGAGDLGGVDPRQDRARRAARRARRAAIRLRLRAQQGLRHAEHLAALAGTDLPPPASFAPVAQSAFDF